jgi:hypothetical protein
MCICKKIADPPQGFRGLGRNQIANGGRGRPSYNGADVVRRLLNVKRASPPVAWPENIASALAREIFGLEPGLQPGVEVQKS